MRVPSFALENSKATAATQLANEEITLGWIPLYHVLEDRIANFILKAVVVLARFSEEALVDFPRNVCNPYVSHRPDP
jgi:hypothetical protein